MLEYGLKDVTKDIDLVCRDAEARPGSLKLPRALVSRRLQLEKRYVVWAWTGLQSREVTPSTSLPAGFPTIIS